MNRQPPKTEDQEVWIRTLNEHIRVLERDRQRFHAIVSRADVGFLLLDPAGKVVWSNETYRERFARAEGDRTGDDCHRAVCGRREPCPDCPVIRTFLRGTVTRHEYSLARFGSIRPVWAMSIPVQDSDGKLEHALVMLQDLSGLGLLERAERALRSNEDQVRALFEQAGAGIATIRADGSFVRANASICRLLSYTEAELTRTGLLQLVHDADLPEAREALREGTASRSELEIRLQARDGTSRWCHCSIAWQFDADGGRSHAIMLVQDVTARKSHTARLAEALARIAGHGEALSERLGTGHPQQHEARAILEATERAAKLLLELAGATSPTGSTGSSPRRDR